MRSQTRYNNRCGSGCTDAEAYSIRQGKDNEEVGARELVRRSCTDSLSAGLGAPGAKNVPLRKRISGPSLRRRKRGKRHFGWRRQPQDIQPPIRRAGRGGGEPRMPATRSGVAEDRLGPRSRGNRGEDALLGEGSGPEKTHRRRVQD